MVRPDLLLADMIAILHPELLPGHRLIWHNRLESGQTRTAGGRESKQ
jgi:hypothetical protein